MTIEEAIRARHTVRQYEDKPIPADVAERLQARIAARNREHRLDLALVLDSADGIGAMAKLMSRSVRNYIVLAGEDRPDLDEALGYCGADLMLYAQTLGLNTWWIGGMYRGAGARKHLDRPAARVIGVIAVGYGRTQGVPHKSKTAAEISRYRGDAPQWFTDGVAALLLAPTALNRQPYLAQGDGTQVSLTAGDGHFAGVDLGIGKYHFEVGAGKENFEWK